MIRRIVVLAVLAVIITAGTIISVSRNASAQDGGNDAVPAVQSAGPVTVDENHSYLIGLLLPAVKRVREAAIHEFFVDGKLVATARILPKTNTTSIAFFHIAYQQSALGDGSVRLVIQQRGEDNPIYVSGQVKGPSQVTGVLLPAVQGNGARIGVDSGSAQIIGPEGNLIGILPYVEQHPGGIN